MAITLKLAITGLSAVVTAPPVTFEVETFNFDVEQTLNIGSQSSGAGAGKVTFNPFSITRKPDANSAALWAHLCNGGAIKSMVLTAVRAGSAAAFFSYTMGLVAVKSMAVAAAESGDLIETVTFEYGQATYGAAAQNPDGSLGSVVTSGWDVTKNQKV
jgi:type VI secretion system secreted protein Hcp